MNTTTRTQAQIDGAIRAAATRAANKAAKLAFVEQIAADLDTTVEDAQITLTPAVEEAPAVTEAEAAVVADLLENHGLLASGVAVEVVTGYTGPMIALRERLAAGAYQKAVNGQPCCGDTVAIKLGTLTPAQVIRACIIAMNLPANPYTHLNIGQQSMNLRNKLRGCFKRGEFGFGILAEAVEEALVESNVAHILSPEFAAVQAKIKAEMA